MPIALVVEDEPEIATFAIALFEKFRIEAFSTTTVEAALDILHSTNNIDFLLINLDKERDEIQLAHVVSRRWPEIKLIILSSRSRSLCALPPAVFITKPANTKAIVRIIEFVVHAPADHRQILN